MLGRRDDEVNVNQLKRNANLEEVENRNQRKWKRIAGKIETERFIDKGYRKIA